MTKTAISIIARLFIEWVKNNPNSSHAISIAQNNPPVIIGKQSGDNAVTIGNQQ